MNELRDTPERIWLVRMGDETVWSGEPDPNDCGILDGVEYVRADAAIATAMGDAATITTLQADNAALREGLAFYADNGSYCMIYGFADGDPKSFAPVLQDEGKIARALLEKKP